MRTSAGSAPYKGTTSPIPMIPYYYYYYYYYYHRHHYYYYHIVRALRASLESQAGVTPGFVQIRRLFSICSELCRL